MPWTPHRISRKCSRACLSTLGQKASGDGQRQGQTLQRPTDKSETATLLFGSESGLQDHFHDVARMVENSVPRRPAQALGPPVGGPCGERVRSPLGLHV